MTREEITALFARRQEGIARLDAVALASDHAEEGMVESPSAGIVKGHDAIEQSYRAWFTAFPDLKFQVEELLIDGDRALLEAMLVGTDIGGFMGMAPTGKPFRVPIVCLCTLEGRQILHERRIYDFTGMLVQIGVLKAKPA